MQYIEEKDFETTIKSDGLKLFYRNSNDGTKKYEDHICMLKALHENFQLLKVYVIKNGNFTDKSRDSYEFLFYDDKLIKAFKDSPVAEVSSFIRLKMLDMNTGSNSSTKGHDDPIEDGDEKKIEKSDVVQRIENLLNNHTVLLFMKGTIDMPRCKFSNAVINMLDEAKLKYATYDILEDEELRNELKNYSNWPTYPQLYVNKELIGGHDIIKEMFETEQLKTAIPPEYFS